MAKKGSRGKRGGHNHHGGPGRRRYDYPEGERPESAIDVVEGLNKGEDGDSEDETDSVSASLLYYRMTRRADVVDGIFFAQKSLLTCL